MHERRTTAAGPSRTPALDRVRHPEQRAPRQKPLIPRSVQGEAIRPTRRLDAGLMEEVHDVVEEPSLICGALFVLAGALAARDAGRDDAAREVIDEQPGGDAD
jgi:hypothetical protein